MSVRHFVSFSALAAVPLVAARAGAQVPAQSTEAAPSPIQVPREARAAPSLVEPRLDSHLTTPAIKLSLSEAIDRALAKNPTYETAVAEVRRAEAVVRETKAAWLPTLYGNGSFAHLDGNRVEAGTIILNQNELNLNATATVPLITPRLWVNTEESRLNQRAVAASREDSRRLIAYGTAQAYLAVYTQKFVIEVDERARDNAKSHAGYARQRYLGGVGNLIDEVRAEQELAADEAIVQQSYAQLSAVEESLGILVGADEPVDTASDVDLPEPPSLQEGLESALHRTDVVALGKRLGLAKKVVKDDWSDYSPSLVGTAQIFYQNPPIPTIPRTGYELELLLSVPFYDGGLRYGQARERAALRDEASVAYDAAVRQARSDVRSAYEALLRANAAETSARESARLATQALVLANTAYHGGAVTNIEVIDAERAARDAATQAEIAADTARQAKLTMLAMSGHFP